MIENTQQCAGAPSLCRSDEYSTIVYKCASVLRTRRKTKKDATAPHEQTGPDFGFRSPVSSVSSENRRHNTSCTIMWKRPGIHDRHLHPENPPSSCKLSAESAGGQRSGCTVQCFTEERPSPHQSPCLFIVQCSSDVKVLKGQT